ncbi:hypothetical protein KBY31_10340 [Ruegeria pomeroyi]|nr:hypothetical protein [Ruegeria pomeroyi]
MQRQPTSCEDVGLFSCKENRLAGRVRKSSQDFRPFSSPENGSDQAADRGAVAEDDDLFAVLHRLKTTLADFFQEPFHTDISFDIAGLAADHLTMGDGLAVKDIPEPDFGGEWAG